MCFRCSKEPSHRDGSFEYPQHMVWLRNKKNDITVCTLIWRPAISFNICFGFSKEHMFWVGCSKELSHQDGSFEYPQHIFGWEIKIIVLMMHSYLEAWGKVITMVISTLCTWLFRILYHLWKQCRARSSGFWWSQLIRINTSFHLNIMHWVYPY